MRWGDLGIAVLGAVIGHLLFWWFFMHIIPALAA